MSVYLKDIPLAEAWSRFEQALRAVGRWEALGVEEIVLDEHAVGRTLGESIWARLSVPHYAASAMDGFAVSATDAAAASATHPVSLPVGVQAIYVDTGAPLPESANAVVPIEQVEPLDDTGQPSADPRQPAVIRLRASVTPWQHVRPVGEDIVATELVLSGGHVLRPIDLGAIAAAGYGRVVVSRRPRVAILPTGSELVVAGAPVRPGDIIEFNSLVLAGQVREWGGEAARYPITPDVFEAIRDCVREAAQHHDLILLNAGSSAGSRDFSAQVVGSLGTLLVHGVAVRPGHPVILGIVGAPSPVGSSGAGVPVIGVPGYPVSAAFTGDLFVEPLLARWLGRRSLQRPTVRAVLTRKLVSPPGDDDYVRVAVGKVGSRVVAAPLARGAGVISSLVRADGVVVLPTGCQGLPAGSDVDVSLFHPIHEIDRTICAIGSHDVVLDLVAQRLAARGRRLTSSNVGSLAGLLALRRGDAHVAGSHLLDPTSGDYNVADVRRHLSDVPVRLVTLVGRTQGLLVRRGNPRAVRTLSDVACADVVFVNRQRGAGTRVLLDYHLARLGIPADRIRGYSQEEYTHLAVAVAVASGRADCGLGIAAAAQALDLDFVPLFQERYDLVIPREHLVGSFLSPLFDILASAEFRAAVAALSGYDTTQTGAVWADIN